ncbi:MAG: hypothetical protein LBU64_05115 [Planctomycetota bacterium]|jgi:hypothetical protein|nr:hypothetical protein [Planctomycetota bacterium]
MDKFSASTILNIGSLATFAAFPLLYSAAHGGSALPLLPGGALIVLGMIAPFAARKRAKTD